MSRRLVRCAALYRKESLLLQTRAAMERAHPRFVALLDQLVRHLMHMLRLSVCSVGRSHSQVTDHLTVNRARGAQYVTFPSCDRESRCIILRLRADEVICKALLLPLLSAVSFCVQFAATQ